MLAPMAKMNTIRILLSLAANKDWLLHQFDVKNAFYLGDLEWEVYMDIPLSINLRKIRYASLKKSFLWSRVITIDLVWEVHQVKVKERMFSKSRLSHLIHKKRSSSGRVIALITYVDNIIVTGDDIEESMGLKTFSKRIWNPRCG